MPRSASGAGRGTKRQRTSAPAATQIDEPATDVLDTSELPIPHVDPAVNSLLQNSSVTDPPSPPTASSLYFDAHIGSGKHGGRRRTQRSLLAVRQEALQAGFDPATPLLCKDTAKRSERLLAEHCRQFPKWHMQLKSATLGHTSTATHAVNDNPRMH